MSFGVNSFGPLGGNLGFNTLDPLAFGSPQASQAKAIFEQVDQYGGAQTAFPGAQRTGAFPKPSEYFGGSGTATRQLGYTEGVGTLPAWTDRLSVMGGQANAFTAADPLMGGGGMGPTGGFIPPYMGGGGPLMGGPAGGLNMGGGGLYGGRITQIVGSLSQATLFTPAEQGLLNQISDPAQKATFILQKMMQRESLLATVLTNVSHMLYETAKAIASNIR